MPKVTSLIAAVKSWSYSRLADYEQCPRKFKFKHLDKVKEEQSPAMARGNEIHDSLEGFVMGHKKNVPKELVATMGTLLDRVKEMKKNKAIPEKQVAFNKKWQVVGWFAEDAWLRVMVDISGYDAKKKIAYGADYKSGKIKEVEHADQLELYGIYCLVEYPDAESAEVQAFYVDHGHAGSPIVLKREDLQRLKKKWEKRVAPMFKDRIFKPKPGSLCKWCSFSGRKGGPCDKG
jgi:CRISPR/Cas system-associated exonuclease Cas4 (RecB family)